MKFGGRTKFGGRGKFGGDPLGIDAGFVCDRLIIALSRFKRNGTTGFVKTLQRLSGPLDDPTTWGQIMQLGTPAMLVHYGGTTYSKIFGVMSGNVFEGESSFSIVCVADDYRSRTHRLEGRKRSRFEPGLDHMTRWALYYGGNELARHEGRIQRPRPVSVKYVSYGDKNFVSIVEFAATTVTDFRDGVGENKFKRLGLVGDPLNKSALFAEDNTTPNTNNPHFVSVGYAELDD